MCIRDSAYFIHHPERIVHTMAKLDTDPYGKPAMVYLHEDLNLTGSCICARIPTVKSNRNRGNNNFFMFSDLGTYQPGDGWNVYSEIKRKLTEDYGICLLYTSLRNASRM